MAEIVITSENFEQEVLKSNIPVLLDFWATWCGPCQMIAPVVEEIAEEYEGKLKVGKINIDEQMELALEYKVMSIPTLMLFENGEVKKREVGFMTKQEIEEML